MRPLTSQDVKDAQKERHKEVEDRISKLVAKEAELIKRINALKDEERRYRMKNFVDEINDEVKELQKMKSILLREVSDLENKKKTLCQTQNNPL